MRSGGPWRRALWGASWQAVAHPPLVVPLLAAVVVIAATAPLLDDGYAGQARLGAATLLACCLAATADDPAAEVAAASPYPRRVRAAGRLVVGCVLVVPVVAAMALVAEVQLRSTSLTGLLLQTVAVLAIGPAVGFAVSAWGTVDLPTYVASVGVLAASMSMWVLPTTWSVIETQPWGPPWDAVLIRWAALALLCVAVVAAAWRDPSGVTPTGSTADGVSRR